jgi:hypothetical protein
MKKIIGYKLIKPEYKDAVIENTGKSDRLKFGKKENSGNWALITRK